MDEATGRIFKINRSETNVKIWNLSKELAMPESKICDFENGKRILSDDIIYKLYRSIGLNYQSDINIYDNVVNLVLQLFNCIYLQNKETELVFEELTKIKNLARFDRSYITWLLGELVFMTYNPNEYYEYERIIKILNQHTVYLEPCFMQILYDTLGVYYKNNNQIPKALEYLNKGMQYNTSKTSLGMIFYHKAMILVDNGLLSEAMLYITKAKKIFDETMSFSRSIMARFELAIIHGSLRHFEYANDLFNECIIRARSIGLPRIINIYNNLMYNLLLWGKYEKVIECSDKVFSIDKTCPNIYFYIAFAYWKLNDIENMKVFKKKIYTYKSNAKLYDQYLYDAFSTYVSNRSVEIKEKKLIKAYDETLKEYKISQCLFIVELLVELFKKSGDLKKIIYYQDSMINLYKKLN